MYEAILIATDGSEQAMNAVEEGLRLATELDAHVDVLYVAEKQESMLPFEGDAEEEKKFGAKLTTEVREIAEDAGLECYDFVEEGIPSEEIADYAERNAYDHIVMGSSGRSNLENILVGSTAERVISKVDVPVTVVNKPPADRLQRVEWKLQSDEILHGSQEG